MSSLEYFKEISIYGLCVLHVCTNCGWFKTLMMLVTSIIFLNLTNVANGCDAWGNQRRVVCWGNWGVPHLKVTNLRPRGRVGVTTLGV